MRIDEAEELVDAIIDIIALEEEAEEDADDDEFIALQ